MNKFELNWLGMRVDPESCAEARDADSLFMIACGAHADAVITLDLFEKSVALMSAATPQDPHWPYIRRRPFTLATAFITAVDMLLKACTRLTALAGADPRCAAAIVGFKARVPDLVDVRNSIQHAEERILGRKQSGPIKLLPINDGHIHAPAGNVVVIGDLVNRAYTITTASGTVGRVRVDADVVSAATAMLQATICAFTWTGPVLRPC